MFLRLVLSNHFLLFYTESHISTPLFGSRAVDDDNIALRLELSREQADMRYLNIDAWAPCLSSVWCNHDTRARHDPNKQTNKYASNRRVTHLGLNNSCFIVICCLIGLTIYGFEIC